eukprot:TRINITY_DN751_c0_g1_i2.p1 TRINITY_DN751_c0_g1~~TRINITY_DN751_c0_g1_i2.p1  ORF type:complete len:501 (-),score=90.90 TRINITY_DN751_c0_g1_i2:243-1745(-)
MAFLKRSSKKLGGRSSFDSDEEDEEEPLSNRTQLQFNLTQSQPGTTTSVPERDQVQMLKRKSLSSSHLAVGAIASPSTSFPAPASAPSSPVLDEKKNNKKKMMFNSFTKSLKRSFSGKPQQQVNPQNELKTTRDITRNDLVDDPIDFDDTGIDYTQLTTLLVMPDLTIVRSLCSALLNSDEASIVPQPLIALLDANGKSFSIFTSMIQSEIQKTTDEATLFRNSSGATMLMTAFGRHVGELYLHQLLKPLFFELPKNVSFEIDPGRIRSGTQSENMQNLKAIAKKFIEKITQSVDHVPKQIKQLCTLLQSEVSKKYPESRLSSVGGFFFLRFICPAIVTPDSFGIISDVVDSNMRRGLILVSKILQSLTNGVLFGEKESYMVPLNDFIKEHTSTIHAFFDKLTATELETQIPPTSVVVIERKSMRLIFQFIRTNLRKIHDELSIITLPLTLDYDPYRDLQKVLTTMKKTSRNTIEISSSKSGSDSPRERLSAAARRSIYI